jgi:hypothetical protein
MTGLLLDCDLKPQEREFAETIRASGETLLTIHQLTSWIFPKLRQANLSLKSSILIWSKPLKIPWTFWPTLPTAKGSN